MRPCFLVLGYGIPRNILTDENYRMYLKCVFNHIFAWCVEQDIWNPVIIFSGGKTDMVKPYRRTEAGEMVKLFRTLMGRSAVKRHARLWTLISETRAFSTLDNFLYAKDILRKRKIEMQSMIVFGEQTRLRRITVLARKIFKRSQVITIDFDQSPNRYLDPKFLTQKESEALRFDLVALQGQKALKKHRTLFKQKFAFLRQAGSDHHVEAVRLWWEKELQESLTA
ncbi:hypothetical protein EXS71_01465 [Candidatus Uhrbacteria bacterium]|nr:hypothetical protein [Candidatus Uhrbacteria bacterium]